ncbi:MAG: fibrobacter succinogenes major paralogous domain-containing protein [Bacteroidales bacterium]
MKKAIFLTSLVALIAIHINAQQSTITLAFNADNNGESVSMDSLKIKNLTQNAEVMLYAPVTTYELVYVGINSTPLDKQKQFVLFQNHPNPFCEETKINISLSKKEVVNILVLDVYGRKVSGLKQTLDPAMHAFSFVPASEGCYYLTAVVSGESHTVKMISAGNAGSGSKLDYLGLVDRNDEYSFYKITKDLPFNMGDQLLFVGYSELGESGIADTPESDNEYMLQFASNIPCIEQPTVDYGGQVYNTIQIFNQCWFAENLNVGEMIYAPYLSTNNDTIEKYCMVNYESNCDLLGGLYFWDEMMAYTNESGSRGICPEGWHIPADTDWKILEGAADSEYGIGDLEWDYTSWRGSDIGGNLKQEGTTLWEPPNTGASDAFGFTALPCGYFVEGDFWGPGYKSYFWSSDPMNMFFRNLDWNMATIKRGVGTGNPAFSVRCIKNND